MDHDLILIVGLGLLCLSLPSLFSALIDDRPPLAAGFGLAFGTGLALWSVLTDDRAFNPADLPDRLFTVIGRYIL